MLAAIAVVACAHPQGAARSRDKVPSGGFYEGMVGVYAGVLNHLEGVRRGSCPMYPSCSQYSRQAVARHGFATGWVMTMDRLMRCGRDELKTAPRVFAHGSWRYSDPLEQNQGVTRRDHLSTSAAPLRPAP